MRKTKACVRSRLMTMAGRLVMRTCTRERAHTGRHADKYGNWVMEDSDVATG